MRHSRKSRNGSATLWDPFPSEGHLASWAGLCSGMNESAGKKRSSRTRKGSRWLRQTMVQAAWAASHTKTTYLGAQYRRLAFRRGRKRALVALAHTMLGIVYHMLKKGTVFIDLRSRLLRATSGRKADAPFGSASG